MFDPAETIGRTEVSIREDEESRARGDYTGGLPAGRRRREPDELRAEVRELAKNLAGATIEIKDDGSLTSVTKFGSESGTWVLGRNAQGDDVVVMTWASGGVDGKYLVPGEDGLLVSTFTPVFTYRRAR